VTLLFQNIIFFLYVLTVWIYVYIATILLTPKGKLYFEQRLHDPIVINARTSQLVSLFVCGSGTVMVVLLLAPFFITVLGVADWIDFLVAFSGAAIVEVYAYTRKYREDTFKNK
jgi:hypothetical protein